MLSRCFSCDEPVPNINNLEVRCGECNRLAPSWSSWKSCCICGKEGCTLYNSNGHACADCIEQHCFVCDGCHQPHMTGRTVNTLKYCKWCYDEFFYNCATCGKRVRNAQVRGTRYDRYCQDCVPKVQYDRCSGSIKSNRAYGVEIECSGVYGEPDYNVWDEKDEHCGTEFVSCLLHGDAGLYCIEQLYEDVEPAFNDTCGLHVHVDVRDFNDEQLLNLVRALKDTKDTWFDYVNYNRHDNQFCYADLPDINEYDGIVNVFNKMAKTRYHWVNLHSIRNHGSIEFRLHEATEDTDKINTWIMMIVNFVSDVKEMSVV